MTAEQKSASDPRASAWVGASAGTGKTKVLTDRVLRLMLAGTPPDRILCLTFTKAAAAEMSNRIARRLAGWALADEAALAAELAALEDEPPEPETLAFARSLFARVLDVPGGLKIQTIHSFCQTLLGRFPLEAGVPPAFTLIDERMQAELLADAEARVLGAARSGRAPHLAEALDRVSGMVAQDAFAKVMGALVADRARFGRAIAAWRVAGDEEAAGGVEAAEAAAAERLIDAIWKGLGFDAPTDERDVVREACAEAAFEREHLKRCAESLAAGSSTDRKRGALIADWLAAAERESGWDAYAGAFLTGKEEILKTLATKEAQQKDPDLLARLAKEAERVHRAQQRCRLARTGAATAALVRLGAAQIAAYEGEKRRRAALDFEDLILIAGRMLDNPGVAPWVLYKLDNGIDHILIDEAQDTSPSQWNVIRRIADEFHAGEGARTETRTIFAVGDAKQSIFSFQGADRRVFLDSERDFAAAIRNAGAAFRAVPMTKSFRSTEEVLALVDAVFSSPAALEGVADAPTRHVAHRAGHAGTIELWQPEPARAGDDTPDWSLPVDQALGDSPPGRLAERIAEKISRWIGREDLPSRGRTMRAGDVMVLVRRRNGFVEALVRALKLRGVPVAGADRMVLTDQLAVKDLIALGRFALLPEDDLGLATVLRGPFVGLSEDALFDLAHARAGTLWDALVSRRGECTDFAAAHAFLAEAMGRTDFLRPFEFYARVLGPEGGRGRLLGRLGRDAADPVEEFLSQALAFEKARAPSLEGFLHWIETGAAEIKRDLEQGRDEVRILTVHGSKGLEAPVVFLPDTCQSPTGGGDIFWDEGPAPGGDAPLPYWPGRAENRAGPVETLHTARKAATLEEYRRLLYVALTRAEDRMVVCGWENEKPGSRAGSWYEHVSPAFAALAEAEFGAARTVEEREEDGLNVCRVRGSQTAEPAERRHGADAAVPAEKPPAWAFSAKPPEEPRPSRPLAPSAPTEEEPATLSPIGGDNGRRFARGRLIHRLLQTLPELPAETRREAALRWLKLPGQDLAGSEAEDIAEETLRVLDDSAFAALFGPGSRAEVPVAGRLGLEIVLGQVDRLVVTDAAVLVADYKTNRPPPRDPADVAPAYLRQMALYRAVLSRIWPGRRVDCALVWTDGPRLMPLGPDLLDAHLPAAARD